MGCLRGRRLPASSTTLFTLHTVCGSDAAASHQYTAFFFHFPLRALRQSELERGDVVTPETSADAVATVRGLAADAAAGSTKRSKKKKAEECKGRAHYVRRPTQLPAVYNHEFIFPAARSDLETFHHSLTHRLST